MREIKFRGKRIDTGEWVVGSLVKLNYHNSVDYVEETQIVLHNGHTYVVDPETVGQFSGIYGATEGEEFYEGDIIEHDFSSSETDEVISVEEIKYSCGSFDVESVPLYVIVDCSRRIKRIGNIYENPELINL